MTLRQIIDHYEATSAAQRASVGVTALGTATAAAYRLRRALGALTAEERASLLTILHGEALAVPAIG